MRLTIVTDYQIGEKDRKYYYERSYAQNISIFESYFNNITIIAKRNNNCDSTTIQVPSNYSIHLINPINTIPKLLSNLKGLNKLLNETIKESDMVMCVGTNGYFGYRKAKKLNKPIFVYLGGCVYDTLQKIGNLRKKFLSPIVFYMFRKMIKNADYVQYEHDYLYKKYPTNGKALICSSVKLRIDERVLSLRKENIMKNKQRYFIGLIGYTHNKIKGIDTAIKAFKFLGPKYHFQVLGYGDHTWLDKLAQSIGVQDQIEFLGVKNITEDIMNWLDSLDIYIQPSLTEGLPRATIEAMSRGCPIISSSAGGLIDLIEDQYRIDYGDYKELAVKIKSLNLNPNEKIRLAERNFRIARNYDYQILKKKKDAFLKSIHDKIIS